MHSPQSLSLSRSPGPRGRQLHGARVSQGPFGWFKYSIFSRFSLIFLLVSGFSAALQPEGHILCDYEFDVLIGADGKRNTVPGLCSLTFFFVLLCICAPAVFAPGNCPFSGFQRDEMRGKLAIAITANFVNNRTPAEERVPEIRWEELRERGNKMKVFSGVAYIFNQAFFKEMNQTTGVDLENIVYYKVSSFGEFIMESIFQDDTHYFVMCAKKQSLLDMGVIKKVRFLSDFLQYPFFLGF